MSTAVMPQNTMYDFSDNVIMGSDSTANANHISVQSAAMRLTLSRVASTPGASSSAPTNLALLLGNLSLQTNVHHHHYHHHYHPTNTNQHKRLERTQSAPTSSSPPPAIGGLANSSSSSSSTTSSSGGGGGASNTSRYKTELCRPYEEFGVCKYGDKCQFAHGGGELRTLARHPKYKTELCRTYHTVGFCPYGPRCHFVHNQEEVLRMVAQAMLGAVPTTNDASSNRSSNKGAELHASTLSLAPPPPPQVRPFETTTSTSSESNNSRSSSLSSSLSQSPTSSLCSFFNLSEPELCSPPTTGGGGAQNNNCEEQRLPVFNRISLGDTTAEYSNCVNFVM